MIIEYEKNNLGPLVKKGAKIKVKETNFKDIEKYPYLFMLKEKNKKDYTLGEFISKTKDNLNIYDRDLGMFENDIKIINKTEIEKIYQVIYINIDLAKI